MGYVLRKINLKEVSLSRMFDKHNKAGYIIITAFRGGDADVDNLKTNYKNNDLLKQDIKSSGYGYFPVWGGYVEDGVEVKEQSFVVTSYTQDGEYKSTKELFNLGKTWCEKYNQDSFLYKPQGDDSKAHFVKSDGSVDFTFSAISPTQASDVFFTNLNKSRMKNKDTKSFTYRENVVYLAYPPMGLNEAYMRKNELYFRMENLFRVPMWGVNELKRMVFKESSRYLGNCTQIGGNSKSEITKYFGDATAMSNVVDNKSINKKISAKEFFEYIDVKAVPKKCNLKDSDFFVVCKDSYGIISEKDWGFFYIYDNSKDIRFFFKRMK